MKVYQSVYTNTLPEEQNARRLNRRAKPWNQAAADFTHRAKHAPLCKMATIKRCIKGKMYMYNNSLYQTKYSLLSCMTLPLFVIECYDLHTSAATCVILSQNIGGVVVVPFPGRSSDVSKRILTFSRGSTISRGLANKKDKNKEPQYKPQVIRLEKTLPSNCCQVQPSEPRLDVGRVLDIAPSPSCSTTAFQEAVILFVYLPDLIKMNGNQPTIQGQTQLSKSRSTTISDIRIGPSTGN